MTLEDSLRNPMPVVWDGLSDRWIYFCGTGDVSLSAGRDLEPALRDKVREHYSDGNLNRLLRSDLLRAVDHGLSLTADQPAYIRLDDQYVRDLRKGYFVYALSCHVEGEEIHLKLAGVTPKIRLEVEKKE